MYLQLTFTVISFPDHCSCYVLCFMIFTFPHNILNFEIFPFFNFKSIANWISYWEFSVYPWKNFLRFRDFLDICKNVSEMGGYFEFSSGRMEILFKQQRTLGYL